MNSFYQHEKPNTKHYTIAIASLSDRRTFLQLPLEERERILSEQAEAMALHYQQDTEWQDLQTDDLIEY